MAYTYSPGHAIEPRKDRNRSRGASPCRLLREASGITEEQPFDSSHTVIATTSEGQGTTSQ